MAWLDLNPVTKQPWPVRIYPDNPTMISQFTKALNELITSNKGTFIGRYHDILKEAGYDDRYYANLFYNMHKIKKQLKVSSKKFSKHQYIYTKS